MNLLTIEENFDMLKDNCLYSFSENDFVRKLKKKRLAGICSLATRND